MTKRSAVLRADSPGGGMPRCFSNPRLHWALSVAALIVLALLMTEYHRWRGRPWEVFSFNKGLAIAATALLAWACTLGPLYRLGMVGPRLLRSRRPVAVVGSLGVGLHILLVFTFLWDRFGWSWVVENPVSAALGGLAALGLGAMAVTSWPWAPRRLGMSAWLRMHSPARWILVAAAAHYIALGKPANWVAWARTFDQPVPPGTTVPTAMILIVVVVAGIARRHDSRVSKKPADAD